MFTTYTRASPCSGSNCRNDYLNKLHINRYGIPYELYCLIDGLVSNVLVFVFQFLPTYLVIQYFVRRTQANFLSPLLSAIVPPPTPKALITPVSEQYFISFTTKVNFGYEDEYKMHGKKELIYYDQSQCSRSEILSIYVISLRSWIFVRRFIFLLLRLFS